MKISLKIKMVCVILLIVTAAVNRTVVVPINSLSVAAGRFIREKVMIMPQFRLILQKTVKCLWMNYDSCIS